MTAIPAIADEAKATIEENSKMTNDDPKAQTVQQAIDDLIQTATTYDVDTLDRIYHDSLHVIMIDADHNLNTANKEAFKGLFASKRDAGDPPMNTWAKYHSIDVNGDNAHVLLSRKNDLSGVNMDLTLSIDLIFEDDRWQVIREVIFLRPEEQPS
ncbi:nuclear transport factor 2 family protein [Yoonia sp. SS1-5]|uniref:Nuclear transport factor 2 family protein n=1 Tax=Yoonia rhodophyticola TaxID=3137370 RepID=A0AAN0M6L1_9RHOB